MRREVSPQFQQRWRDFRAVMDAAAAQFTGQPDWPLSVMYAQSLIGGGDELARALNSIAGEDLAQASFSGNAQEIYIEISIRC